MALERAVPQQPRAQNCEVANGIPQRLLLLGTCKILCADYATKDHEAVSPTSTTISESGGSFYRMNEPPRPTLRSFPINLNVTRRTTIRSDIALVTCFDPADTELYELWVPRP